MQIECVTACFLGCGEKNITNNHTAQPALTADLAFGLVFSLVYSSMKYYV
jgi:hypothetical protein